MNKYFTQIVCFLLGGIVAALSITFSQPDKLEIISNPYAIAYMGEPSKSQIEACRKDDNCMDTVNLEEAEIVRLQELQYLEHLKYLARKNFAIVYDKRPTKEEQEACRSIETCLEFFQIEEVIGGRVSKRFPMKEWVETEIESSNN